MNKDKIIEHEGIIEELDSGLVRVLLTDAQACEACKMKASCMMADTANKRVDVAVSSSEAYRLGQQVNVQMHYSLGMKALFWGYVAPLLLLLAVLILTLLISDNELTAGSAALLSLLPYYSILWLLKKQLKEKFSFTINARKA